MGILTRRIIHSKGCKILERVGMLSKKKSKNKIISKKRKEEHGEEY